MYGVINEELIVWPVSFIPNLNMYIWTIVINNVVSSEGLKIMILIPVIGVDWEDNGVTNIFEAQDDVLGFIAVFEAR